MSSYLLVRWILIIFQAIAHICTGGLFCTEGGVFYGNSIWESYDGFALTGGGPGITGAAVQNGGSIMSQIL